MQRTIWEITLKSAARLLRSLDLGSVFFSVTNLLFIVIVLSLYHFTNCIHLLIPPIINKKNSDIWWNRDDFDNSVSFERLIFVFLFRLSSLLFLCVCVCVRARVWAWVCMTLTKRNTKIFLFSCCVRKASMSITYWVPFCCPCTHAYTNTQIYPIRAILAPR